MAKKYIDAEKLLAEIKFAKSVYSHPNRVIHGVADGFKQDGRAAMCDDILKKIDSLQQETPEDLEKEIKNYYYDNFAFISSAHNPTKDIISDIAHHFYELGLNARKED